MPADPNRALFYPLETGAVQAPETPPRVLYVNAAYDGEALERLGENATCVQWMKRKADPFLKAGLDLEATLPPPTESFDIAFLLGTKQHMETRFYLSAALARLRTGGLVVVAAANDAGGGRLQKDFESLGLPTTHLSKYKSRVVWAQKNEHFNRQCADSWWDDGHWQTIRMGDDDYITKPGLFSWDRIDKASALLAASIPQDLAGKGADFGCGYGYLSRQLLQRCPHVDKLYAFDADDRAVEAARKNLKAYGDKIMYGWEDLTDIDTTIAPPLDFIIMNPPFHADKKTQADIGATFIRKAAATLHPGGTLWMVANNHLPYEAVLAASFSRAEPQMTADGFKIIRAVK